MTQTWSYIQFVRMSVTQRRMNLIILQAKKPEAKEYYQILNYFLLNI